MLLSILLERHDSGVRNNNNENNNNKTATNRNQLCVLKEENKSKL